MATYTIDISAFKLQETLATQSQSSSRVVINSNFDKINKAILTISDRLVDIPVIQEPTFIFSGGQYVLQYTNGSYVLIAAQQGTKYRIHQGETISVGDDYQYIVHRNFENSGILDIEGRGELVILDPLIPYHIYDRTSDMQHVLFNVMLICATPEDPLSPGMGGGHLYDGTINFDVSLTDNIVGSKFIIYLTGAEPVVTVNGADTLVIFEVGDMYLSGETNEVTYEYLGYNSVSQTHEIKRTIANGVGSGGSGMYTGTSPSTVQVGNWLSGTDISGSTIVELLENIYAPYNAPTIQIESITPSAQQEYNQQSVTCQVVFSWTKSPGGSNLQSAVIERSINGGSWDPIVTTTSVSLPSSDSYIEAELTTADTLNGAASAGYNVKYRCIFTDSTQANTSSQAQVTWKNYAAPTAALTNTTTPALQGGKFIRVIGGSAPSNQITGNITRNSPNVNISNYTIQADYNNTGSWTDIAVTEESFGPGSGSIGTKSDATMDLENRSTYSIRAFVKDGQNPSGVSVAAVSSFSIFNPIFFGMTSESNPASVNIGSDLSPVPNGGGAGQRNYVGTSSDKTINGLSFVAAGNRYCIAFPSSYGTLTNFTDTSNNLNYLPNFTNDTQTVNFSDGTSVTYRVYVGAVVGSGTYTININ